MNKICYTSNMTATYHTSQEHHSNQ